MNSSTEFTFLASVALVSLLGICFAFFFGSRAPKASLWALGACALSLFLVFHITADGSLLSGFQIAVFWGGAYAMLLIAVFAGRPYPSASAADSRETLWHFVVTSFRAHPSAKAVFISLSVLIFFLSVIITMMLAPIYESTARIRVERDRNDISGLSAQPGSQPASFDPYFIRTESEVLRSQVILNQVATNRIFKDADGRVLFEFLGVDRRPASLQERWSAGHVVQLTTQEATSMLRRCLEVLPIPNTSLIQIRVASGDATEARDIANAVALAYSEYRVNEAQRRIRARIEALTNRLAELQRRVEEEQKTVEALGIKLQVPSTLVVGEFARLASPAEGPMRTFAMEKDVTSRDAIAWAPFFDANQRLRELEQFRQVLFYKLESELTELKLPKTCLATIEDRAYMALYPAHPKREVNIFLGAVGGLLIASVVTLLMISSGHKQKRQPVATEVLACSD